MVKSHSPLELYRIMSFSFKMNGVWSFTFLLLFLLVNLGPIQKVHGRSIRELGDRCSDISGCDCGEQCVDLLDMKPCRAENASDCVCLEGCAVANVFIPAGVTRRNTYCNTCRCVSGDGVPMCTKLPWCNLPDGVPLYRDNPNCVEMIRINFPLRHEIYARSRRSWRYPPYMTRALNWRFPFITATRSSKETNTSPLKSRSTGEELKRSLEKARTIDWWFTPISKIRSKNGLNPPFQEIKTRNSWYPYKETRSMENTEIPLGAAGLNGPYPQPMDTRSKDSFHSNDEVKATPKQSRQNYEFNDSLKKRRAMNSWLHHLAKARSNDIFILRPKKAQTLDWMFQNITDSKSNDESNTLPKKTRAMDWWFPGITEAKINDDLIIPPKTTRNSMRRFPFLTKSNDQSNILPKKTREMDWWFPGITEASSNDGIILRPKIARALNWWLPHITGSNSNEIDSLHSESRSHAFNPPPKQSRAMDWWNPSLQEKTSKIGVNLPFENKRAMDWLLQPHQDDRSTKNNDQPLQHTALKKQYNTFEGTRYLNWFVPPPKEAR